MAPNVGNGSVCRVEGIGLLPKDYKVNLKDQMLRLQKPTHSRRGYGLAKPAVFYSKRYCDDVCGHI